MNSKEIYFEKLSAMNVRVIGLFGSRQEILNMLTNFRAISPAICNLLRSDVRNMYIDPGIHVILPVDLQKSGNFSKWDGTLYLFYWPMVNSFNMEKMKAVKYMRKVLSLSVCTAHSHLCLYKGPFVFALACSVRTELHRLYRGQL